MSFFPLMYMYLEKWSKTLKYFQFTLDPDLDQKWFTTQISGSQISVQKSFIMRKALLLCALIWVLNWYKSALPCTSLNKQDKLNYHCSQRTYLTWPDFRPCNMSFNLNNYQWMFWIFQFCVKDTWFETQKVTNIHLHEIRIKEFNYNIKERFYKICDDPRKYRRQFWRVELDSYWHKRVKDDTG